jgi:CspA family cold shock protein
MESCSTETSSSSRQLGRVKWFNNKAGYGFITINDGPLKDTDIFVHHIGINVSNEQYKYLVQGEYVEYDLEKTEGGKHEYQAGKVSGLNGGKLMCETRRDFKQMRSSYQELNQSQDQMDQSTTTHVQTTKSKKSKTSSVKKQTTQ